MIEQLDIETVTQNKVIGVFARNDAHPALCGAGIGAFAWFYNYNELAEYFNGFVLQECLLMRFDESEHEKVTEFVTQLSEQYLVNTHNNALFIEKYNQAFEGVEQIDWIGTFNDLKNSKKEWCQGVRKFILDYSGPVEEEHIEHFIDELSTYGF